MMPAPTSANRNLSELKASLIRTGSLSVPCLPEPPGREERQEFLNVVQAQVFL